MVAIIPAREGSTGLPGKNVKLLCGKPLISYTIEAALNADEINRVIVTTDSMEIADLAKKMGADVPFIRPQYLAEDNSSAIDVYLHSAKYVMDCYGCSMKSFVVLLPTAPLRDKEDIDKAIKIWKEKKAITLVSVMEAETPASWYYRMKEDGSIKNAGFDIDNAMDNRQGNARYYIPNGAIYILNYDLLKTKRTYYTETTIGYIMPRKKSVDIDNIDDFKYVEYLMKQNTLEN